MTFLKAAAFQSDNTDNQLNSKTKAASMFTKVPQKQFLANYMSSPMYKKRLSNFNIINQPNTSNLLNTTVSQVSGPGSIAYNQINSSKTNTNKAGFPIIQGKSNINVDRGQIGFIDKTYGVDQKPDSIMAHELSHVTRDLSPEEENFIASLNKKPEEANVYNDFVKYAPVDSKTLAPLKFSDYLNTMYNNSHDARPNEIKADLDALRFQMLKKGIYDTSKRDMTIDDYNNASQDNDIKNSLEFKRLNDRFNPKDLIKINNTVASTIAPDDTESSVSYT